METTTLEEAAKLVGRPWTHPGTGVIRWYIPTHVAGAIRNLGGLEWRMGADPIRETTAKRHLKSKVWVEKGRVYIDGKQMNPFGAWAHADTNIIAAAAEKQVAA